MLDKEHAVLSHSGIKRQLTEEQTEEFRASFSAFDKDGDGTISKEELGSVMQLTLPEGNRLAADELHTFFRETDTDGERRK